jgi:multiple antibiotic resistance protein
MSFTDFINFFITLLIIANPMAALPAFLEVTSNESYEQRKKTAVTTGFAVLMILILMTFIGKSFLEILGIEVYAFQITGGLILLLLAFSMLNASPSRIQETKEEQKEAKRKDSVAIVPLAIPLIAGPGAISTIILEVSTKPGLTTQIFVSIAALLVAIFMGGLLYFASGLEKKLGQTGLNIFSRLGGLILAAMSIQVIANGLIGLFPVLGQVFN